MIMALLSLFSFLFYCIYFSDIRVKTISRIIEKDNNDEIHIATDGWKNKLNIIFVNIEHDKNSNFLLNQKLNSILKILIGIFYIY